MAKKSAKSPYQKHGKAPFLYSEPLRRWRDAIRRNDQSAASEADEQWRAMRRRGAFGPVLGPIKEAA